MTVLKPPGAIDDFARRPKLRRGLARGWDVWLRRWLDDLESAVTPQGGRFRHPRPTDPDVIRQEIAWDAFPKAITQWYRNDPRPDEERWRVSEILRPRPYGKTEVGDPVWVNERQQDEYCEWFVRRHRAKGGSSGSTSRARGRSTGCSWRTAPHVLFRGVDDGPPPVDGDLSLVLELYREHIDASVAIDDLVWQHDILQPTATAGTGRRPQGRRVQPVQQMEHDARRDAPDASGEHARSAEIGSRPTRRSFARGAATVIESADELICCAGYGDPNRSSDPIIGGGVNGARARRVGPSPRGPDRAVHLGARHDAFSGRTARTSRTPGSQPRTAARGSRDGSCARLRAVGTAGTRRREIRTTTTASATAGRSPTRSRWSCSGSRSRARAKPRRASPATRSAASDPDGRPVKAIIDLDGDCAKCRLAAARAPHTGAAGAAGDRGCGRAPRGQRLRSPSAHRRGRVVRYGCRSSIPTPTS